MKIQTDENYVSMPARVLSVERVDNEFQCVTIVSESASGSDFALTMIVRSDDKAFDVVKRAYLTQERVYLRAQLVIDS